MYDTKKGRSWTFEAPIYGVLFVQNIFLFILNSLQTPQLSQRAIDGFYNIRKVNSSKYLAMILQIWFGRIGHNG